MMVKFLHKFRTITSFLSEWYWEEQTFWLYHRLVYGEVDKKYIFLKLLSFQFGNFQKQDHLRTYFGITKHCYGKWI
jgi:hypothetical protein